MKTKNKQLKLLKDLPKAYGGELLKTRKGRARGRPLDTKNSIHLVLRSSKATGKWSFNYKSNPRRIRAIIERFAKKYGIGVLSLANVGNHLHLQIKLGNRYTFSPFIRAITGAIAMVVTGVSRWRKDGYKQIMNEGSNESSPRKLRFWDYRPYTRVIIGWRAFLTLKDYIELNQWEGFGYKKSVARELIAITR